MRSGNPSLKTNTFNNFQGQAVGNEMTLQGTINKSFIMFVLIIASAGYTWYQYTNDENISLLMMIGAIGGFIMALITSFVKKASPVTAPIYAILEGLFIGGISAYYETKYNGITVQAVTLTFAVFLALLIAYKTRIIKATENFKLGVFAATMGIFIAYLINFVLNIFGIGLPYLHDSSPIGIGISIFIVIIAALNLVLDFDFIEKGSEMRCPKYMEWYAAFGLMVTLIWLYIEILRLLSKIYGRRN